MQNDIYTIEMMGFKGLQAFNPHLRQQLIRQQLISLKYLGEPNEWRF
jgi:hypothetical protein